MVKRMLMKKEEEQPLSKKTPNGGRMIAMISLKMSEQVKAIL